MSEFIFKIENRLILQKPTPQTSLDIFKGTWISKFPDELSNYIAGELPLFEDTRIPDSTRSLGPVTGKRVLDLGPLEGGIAYVLEKMGAESIIAVEANAILYLKCLISKELLNMRRVRFLCGDVMQYLQDTTDQFDMCVASGILYHMEDPVELLWLLSKQINQLVIWTHYYDEADVTRNKIYSFKSVVTKKSHNITYNYHQQEYGDGFETNVYCGGTARFSNWVTKWDILTALNKFDYQNNIIYDGDSVNGPFLLLTASK